MKKRVLFAALLFFLTGLQLTLQAHPPGSVDAVFESDFQKLTIHTQHSVGSKIAKHYVNKVEVSINGKKAVTQLTSTQTDANGIKLIYLLPGVKSGDQIIIKATCNIFGSKETIIEVE